MFKKIFKAIFVISGVLASVWKVFIKFRWHGQNTIDVQTFNMMSYIRDLAWEWTLFWIREVPLTLQRDWEIINQKNYCLLNFQSRLKTWSTVNLLILSNWNKIEEQKFWILEASLTQQGSSKLKIQQNYYFENTFRDLAAFALF